MTARGARAPRRRQDPDLDELGRGMHLAFLNAEALAEDATRLLPTSPARVLSLAVLALEELGKVWVLYEAAGEVDPPRSWSERLTEFRDDRVKQEVAGEYGALLFDVFRAVGLPPPEQLLPRLDAMKQAGLYVEWGGNRFTAPSDFGRREAGTARRLLDAVRLLLSSIEGRHRGLDQARMTAHGAPLGRLVLGGLPEDATRRLVDQVREGRVSEEEVRRLARERLLATLRNRLRQYAQATPGAATPLPAPPSDPGEGRGRGAVALVLVGPGLGGARARPSSLASSALH